MGRPVDLTCSWSMVTAGIDWAENRNGMTIRCGRHRFNSSRVSRGSVRRRFAGRRRFGRWCIFISDVDRLRRFGVMVHSSRAEVLMM